MIKDICTRTSFTYTSEALEKLIKKHGKYSGIANDIQAELMEDLADSGYGEFLVHSCDNGSFIIILLGDASIEEVAQSIEKCLSVFEIEDYL